MVRESFWSNFNCFGIFSVRMPVARSRRSNFDFILIGKYVILEDLSTSMEFLVCLSTGSDPTFPVKRRLLPSATSFHSQPCSTLAFRKALFWVPFYSFCTPNFSLHSFLTSISQTTPSCARFLPSRSIDTPVQSMRDYISDIKTWIISNKLKLQM